MINCNIVGLVGLAREIEKQKRLLDIIKRRGIALVEGPDDCVCDATKDRFRGWVGKLGKQVADEFEFRDASLQMNRLLKRLDQSTFTNRDLEFEVIALQDAIENNIKNQLIFRYPNAKAEVVKSWQSNWEAVIEAFPSSKNDILAGVDLWALGHETASVFHMMRVLECGIKGLAHNVGKTYSMQVWQNIIEEIEAAIKQEANSLKKGAAKSERLQFLSEAATQLRYFKDGWRNYVSHNKCTYDEKSAFILMNHTCEFMTVLSKKISET